MLRHLLPLIVCLVCSAGCGKVKQASLTPSGDRIYVIGHGGSGFSDKAGFPPNSWESAVRAVEQYNADGVEIDVLMSLDSILFMYHDENLEGASFCSGCVYTYKAQDLRRCRYKPLQEGQVTQFLTPVEDLVARFAARQIKPVLFLDLKVPAYCLPTTEENREYAHAALQGLDAIIKKYAANDWVIVQCGSRRWLSYARSRFPDMQLMLDYIKDSGDIDYAAQQGLYGVAASSADLSAAEVREAHDKGLKVQLYGARLRGDIADALNKSPDYFLADNIPLVQQMVY